MSENKNFKNRFCNVEIISKFIIENVKNIKQNNNKPFKHFTYQDNDKKIEITLGMRAFNLTIYYKEDKFKSLSYRVNTNSYRSLDKFKDILKEVFKIEQ